MNGRSWLVVVLAPLGVLLYLIDPEKGGYFSCPFRLLTGLLCPGCGSQRALHDVMHFRVAEAFDHNALLVLSLPVLALQLGFSRLSFREKPALSPNWVFLTWGVIAVGWGIFRNLYVSPHTGH